MCFTPACLAAESRAFLPAVKFKLTISNLNKETIIEACSINKIPKEISKMLTKILEECESARYAPISNEDSFKTLKESKSIITKIEAHAKV